ncbi:hypothetical protein LCGC14_1639530 [marine sediment metagenome]|uniref:Uncharacterized protein n=1 Tax=marine sediment metagenome TaxID=412755 RepID=A0A0F9I0M3_9ZZZZ
MWVDLIINNIFDCILNIIQLTTTNFVEAVNKLKELGKGIQIWSFKISFSKKLKKAAGYRNIHYIDEILDEIEFSKGLTNTTGKNPR